ncbi:hypothetical protein G7Y89_g5530 [Cudoniella acicularis]|uniref:Small ribosomal subunit protein uS10m n=1 Tax=Cudoniella acicularis TaxID=354080 RepID=A0A8H4W3A9_9HELO|nr:hypothetical protein G7Y89_g5530 [Cudoniella acicularis]
MNAFELTSLNVTMSPTVPPPPSTTTSPYPKAGFLITPPAEAENAIPTSDAAPIESSAVPTTNLETLESAANTTPIEDLIPSAAIEREKDATGLDFRLPRSVQAVYLRPLRRQAEYGVPSCDLQLRSYSVRNLEFFADFALRAAYYLGLPAFGPVPLPRIVERWTVPRSSFIFKKSQENFERRTVRRLIQIKDGNPETVEVWLAFLRKHAYYGIGMKANVFEFTKLGVGKTMDIEMEQMKGTIDKTWEQVGSKLSLKDDASPLDESSKAKLKLGLFSYPVLQAADILVHRATHVPVGEDQSQHLEFARECATNFNSTYGPRLIQPKTILSPAKRVMSLQEPHLKMSKSHSDPRSRIIITDTPEAIQKKIMSALTDSTNSVSYDPENRPGVSNLLQLLSHFDVAGRSAQDLGAVYGNLGLGQFKKVVAETISNSLEEIRNRYERVLSEDGGKYLDHVQKEGARKARESADETMALVREAVDLPTSEPFSWPTKNLDPSLTTNRKWRFLKEGCPNCEEFMHLQGSQETLFDCTSQVFEGLIALADPSKSWVAKWQRLDGYVKGVYATKVSGKLPEDMITTMEVEARIKYIPRDGSVTDAD